jgi:thiosulfate/3-mercaptopyruvate sulfurtransferase
MLAYTLARYGHARVIILNGGLDRWVQDGGPITKDLPRRREGDFRPQGGSGLPMAYDEFVARKDEAAVVHVDSRSEEQYAGKSLWPKEGHIPGAVNVPWSSAFQPRNLSELRPREEVARIFAEAGVTPDKEVICHCGSGRKAAAQLCVLKWLLRMPRVRLFEGSFIEWCAHPGNATVSGMRP